MYDHQLMGYRKLTVEEQKTAVKAINWLLTKRLRPHEIALLSERNIDREAKYLNVRVEKGRLVFLRKIRYEGSDLDTYLTEVLPCLKVEKWLFPNQGWTGVKPSFGFHIHIDEVEQYADNRRRMPLTFQKGYGKLEVSTKESNIQKQIMVGRRIALRA